MAEDRVDVEVRTETKRSIANLAKLAVGIYAAKKAFDAVIKVTKEMVDVAKEAAYLKQINMAFESMAEAAGESSTEILKSMRELSGGTISTMEMIQSANRAMILGLPIEDLDKMMRIARASATATGAGVKQMFDDIVVGIGRQSRMILDNLGIIVQTEKANQDYAEAMGIVGRELTDTESRQAFLNATLIAGEEIIKKVGKAGQEITSAEKWQIMTAAVADLRVEMGMRLLPAFESVTTAIAGYARKLANTMEATRELKAIIEKINEGNIDQIETIEDLNDAYNAEFQAVMDINAQIKRLKTSKEGHVGINAILIAQLEEDKQGHLETAKAIEIVSEKRRIEGALLSEINRKEKEAIDLLIEQEEARKANAASIAEFHATLDEAYAKTGQGAIELKEAEIAKFEAMLLLAENPVVIEKLEYIIELHKEELEALKEVEEAVEDVAATYVSAAEESLAYHILKIEQIKAEEEAEAEAFENWKKIAREKMDIAQNTADMFQDTFSAYYDWQFQALEDNLASGQITQEQYAEKRKQIMRNEAKAEKAKALFDIAINTASAFVDALPRIGLAFTVAALGGIRAAFVAATPIPTFGEGAVVTKPTIALIGEKGPEVITPLTSPGIGGGGRIVNQINVYLGTKKIYSDIARAIRNKQIPIYRGAIVD